MTLRHCEERSDEAIQLSRLPLHGLLRGACHRARIRATRWLAMTLGDRYPTKPPGGVADWLTITCLNAGGLGASWLHWLCEAVSRVRSHISPGPYRSFRELSLARSVDLVTWCPPTFVGNSGIERSNGHRGFALLFFAVACFLLAELFP